ncbi:AAA family ATPase [Lentisphaerota bacterium WC36G]|nr:AAA family ATPase [Lentisphaerae bacterium WC36]
MKKIINYIDKTMLNLSDNLIINQKATEEWIMKAKASLTIIAKINSNSWKFFCDPFDYRFSNPVKVLDAYGNEVMITNFEINKPFGHFTNRDNFFGISSTDLLGQHSAINPKGLKIIEGEFPNFVSDLFQGISKGKTPASICRFFKEKSTPWSKFSNLGGKHSQHLYYDKVNLDSNSNALYTIPGNLDEIIEVNELPQGACIGEKVTEFCNFYDEYGEIIMCVKVSYDFYRKTKSYIPITLWNQANSKIPWLCTLPLNADKQPLFNLHLISNDETDSALVTLDLQLAANNSTPRGWALTSILDVENFENTDWEPLKSLDQVCILIHPHHGMNFEESVVKYHKLAKYLEQEEGFDNLKFLLMDMNYTDAKYINSFSDLMNYQTTIKNESVRDLSKEEFEDLKNAALDRLNIQDIWNQNDTKTTESCTNIVQQQTNKMEHILFPCIAKGESSIIMAQKSTGKSNIAFTIAALALNDSPSNVNALEIQGIGSPKKSFKVLYLDCENSQNSINKKIDNFVLPFLPTDKSKQQECLDNLIVESLREDRIDYSHPDNHHKVIDLIKQAKGKGNQGQNIDLVIIDPISKFIGAESNQTSDNLSKLLEKLRSLNVATLIVAHTASDGSLVGFKSKLYDAYWVLKAEKTAKGNMSVPMVISHEFQRDDFPNELLQPFKLKFEDKKWNVINETLTLKKTFTLLKNHFKSEYSAKELARCLGISKSSFYSKSK